LGIVQPEYIGFGMNNISCLLSSSAVERALAREYILVKAIADP